jgi:sec-independent protein translocase protein TatA
MIGDLFDSPWKILIVAVVLIVLFGSTKLPGAARSLGKSMRILKTEVKGLHEDDPEPGYAHPELTGTQALAGTREPVAEGPQTAEQAWATAERTRQLAAEQARFTAQRTEQLVAEQARFTPQRTQQPG